MLEHFGVPSSAHDMRLRERARSEAIDGLAGRTVWCAAAVPERRSAAESLRSRLGGAGSVATGRLDIAADGPLRDLARQLDAMLSGHARGQRPLDAEQQEIYAGADTVAAKEQKTAAGDPPWDEELGWSRLLGDIVRSGREEHVGGIVHARPVIAVR
jgi:hypothetical protein